MKPSASLAEKKDLLRKDALARRASLATVERIEKSLLLADHVAALPLETSASVAGYWPIRDEIDVRPMLDVLRQSGHVLCLPVVADPHLVFRELNRGCAMEPAGFGTLAPGAGAEEIRPDVLLMPLAAFDARGNRIGYGKGHYDRAIAALKKSGSVLCIGVAFAIQEVDAVPAETHDKALDGILTEDGFRHFG